jgi:hypothetical protein
VASIGPSCSRSPTPYTSGTDVEGAPSTGPKRLNRPASPKDAATTLSNQVKIKQSQYLLVRVHVDMALDAVLVGVGPGVASPFGRACSNRSAVFLNLVCLLSELVDGAACQTTLACTLPQIDKFVEVTFRIYHQ